MALDQSRPRRHSLSNEDAGSVRTHTGRLDDDSASFGPRRARLPRSKSTSNMLDAVNLPSSRTSEQLRDAVREQISKDDLRALAEFLRTTAPPSDTLPSPDSDECFGFPGSKVARKFSTGSLRRTKRTKGSTQSMQIQLPKNVVPETTAAGHRHNAITIPAPYDNRGPWCRSQYPVFSPGGSTNVIAGPKAWPERTSSKGVLSNGDTQDRRRDTSVSSMHLSTGGLKHERSMASVSVIRPATAKPALNPVEEGHEATQDSQYAAGIVTPLTAPGRQLHRSASESFGNQILAFRYPSEDFKFPTTDSDSEAPGLGRSAAGSLRHRRQLSRMSKKSNESRDLSLQNSAKSSLEQPADLVVKPTLAIPKASVLPESPGFPNMLAKITFPSPPATSRPSSRANSVSSASLNQPSLASPITPPVPSPTPTPPVIQPRTTSKRACVTAQFSPAASLNEIMMRHAQSTSQRGEPGDKPGTSHSSRSTLSTSTRPDSRGLRDGFEPEVKFPQDGFAKDDETIGSISDDLASTANVGARDSLEYDIVGERKSQRQSASSNITGTTDSCSQLAPTLNSFRSSARSDVTTSTFITVRDGIWGHEAPSTCQSTVSIGSLPIMGVDMLEFTESPTLGKGSLPQGARLLAGINVPLSRRRESLPRPSSAASFNSFEGEELEPTKMVERRIARKAKVHEYKQRDLNTVRVGLRTSLIKLGEPQEASLDSPVLGWFPQEAHGLRPPNPSLLTKPDPWSSFDSGDLQNEQGPTDYFLTRASQPVKYINIAQGADITKPETQRSGWTLSPIMVSASIKGEEPLLSLPVKNELVISPMMETASIDPHSEPHSESQQDFKSERSSRRLSTLLLLEGVTSSSPGSRSSIIRPKLKGRTLSRSKPAPITISRNPKTGAIERTIAPPKASIAYNHPLLPAPPQLIDDSPRRWSFPVRALTTPPPTSWDRPPSSPLEERAEEEDEEQITKQHNESEGEGESEVEPERDTKSRLEIFRERLRREKEEKEREINNIVARTVMPTPQPRNYEEDSTPEPPAENGMGEVERRLKRLERNGDAWLRVMGPLLENMTKTLEAMQRDGTCSELTMSEFAIDMDAEARRFSLMNQNVPAILQAQAAAAAAARAGSSSGKSNISYDSPKYRQSPSPSPSNGKDKKIIGRGRSSSSLARLRLQLDRAAKKSLDLTSRHSDQHDGGYGAQLDKDGVKSVSSSSPNLLAAPQTPSATAMATGAVTTTPRSPHKREFEMEMVIRQRIKKQEAEFNELMNKWNSTRPRSRRPSMSSGDGDNNNKPDVPPLEASKNSLGGGSSNDARFPLDSSEGGTPVDPMVGEFKRTSWPKAPSMEALNPPVVHRIRRSNTDLGLAVAM